MIVWRDGALVDEAAPEPPWVGWGVFTTVGCDRGRPLLWPRHRARLAASVEVVAPALATPLPTAAELAALLRTAGLAGPARLRVVVRRASPASSWSMEASATAATGVGPHAPPLRLATVRWETAPEWTGHKTLARLAWDEARRRARRDGADDALLVAADGHVLETSVANLLARFGDLVVTPPAPARCLPGVLRGWLLEHLPGLGLAVEVRDLGVAELATADEVWTSNSVRGVTRVAELDHRRWSHWEAFDRLVSQDLPAPGWRTPLDNL